MLQIGYRDGQQKIDIIKGSITTSILKGIDELLWEPVVNIVSLTILLNHKFEFIIGTFKDTLTYQHKKSSIVFVVFTNVPMR